MTLVWFLVAAPWAVLFTLFTLNRALARARRKRAAPAWRVTTAPARQYLSETPWDRKLDVTGHVHVRVANCHDSILIATVPIAAADFEDLISDAQATAHAKAASLNAYLGSGS